MQFDFCKRCPKRTNHYHPKPIMVMASVNVAESNLAVKATKVVPFENPNKGRFTWEFDLGNIIAAGQFIDLKPTYLQHSNLVNQEVITNMEPGFDADSSSQSVEPSNPSENA